MEIDLDDLDPVAQQRLVLETAMLPQGTVLKDVIDEDVYRLAEERMGTLGVDVTALERFEPWFLAITALDLGMRKLGFQSERGVEQYVVGRARVTDRSRSSASRRSSFRWGCSTRFHASSNRRCSSRRWTELDEGAVVLDKMVASWRAGELESLSAELYGEFDGYPGLYEKLVTKRNSSWVPLLEGMLADGSRHLVVVGALHLVGPGNVIELLKKRGHEVERLH